MNDSFFLNARNQIEETLNLLTPQSFGQPYSSLFDSARYSLLASGKRLRPLIVLSTAQSYGLSQDHALYPACAAEMIHTYSLIHDDLPCMDNDDLRRGKPTLHKVYPEWQALLTGDYFLTYAFEILANAPLLSAEQKIALVRCLSHRSGSCGMLGGQMIDLLFENRTIDWEILEQMHIGKTAALITASLEFGGIIANASISDMKFLQNAGTAIGLAFQLIDDILDETGNQKELGKTIGSDNKNKKSTAVSLLGISEAKERAEALLQQGKKALGGLSCPTPLLFSLFNQMIDRKK